MRSTTIAIAALLLGSTSAIAQEYQGDPDDTPTGPIPSFSFLDRGHIRDRIEVAVDYTRGRSTLQGPVPGSFPTSGSYRLELFGQYLTPSGFGGYVDAALLLRRDGDTEVYGANPEAGLLWARRSRVPLLARAGISAGLTGAENLVPHLFGSPARLTDFAAQLAGVTAARLSASILPRFGSIFSRIDAGLDVPVHEPDSVDAHALARFNAGVGLETMEIAFTAELVNLIDLQAGDGADRFRHSLGFSARYTLYDLQPSIAVGLPLSGPDRRYVSLLVIVGLEYVRGRTQEIKL